jgi:LysM repeat protein
LKTYTWHAGDTLQLVAARFNVSANILREANPGKELVAGAEIVVPRIAGRIIGGSDIGKQTGQGAAIFDPEKDLAATPPAPKAEVIPEGAADAGIPDVVPPAGHETPAPVVKNVSAQSTAKTVSSKSSKAETSSTKTPSKPKTEVASSKNSSKSEGVFSKPGAKAEAGSSKPPKAEVVSSKTKSQDQPSKPKPKASDDTPARSGGQRVHVVSKGDTVFNVAKRFGFTAAEVAKANGLGSDYRIQLGQQLRIPVRR